jgi:hypothetical protein
MVGQILIRRALLKRRTFLAMGGSLLAMVTAQACSPDAGAHPGDAPVATAVREDVPEATPSASTGGSGSVLFGPNASSTIFAPAPAAPTAIPAQAAPAAAPAAQAGPAVAAAPPTLQALVYRGLPDPDVPSTIQAQPATLLDLVHEPGQPWRLRGKLVEVVNYGVLVDVDPTTQKLVGTPMGNAETSDPAGFAFSPRSGGPLPWENEEKGGAENSRVREAARFGEVNAYYYADKVITVANGLLAELGEPPLPLLRVIVNAHSGSRLPGYRTGDGEIRDGKVRPFPGGHYRLPAIARTEGTFLHPVDEMNPTGEVHLGPGRAYITDSKDRNVMVDGLPYVRNAAHVPGIITHETGHHVNGHVADFSSNRNRKPNENINQKIHMDEGTADYWAAVVLETPDIYNWQHVAEGQDDRNNRDLRGPRTTDDYEQGGDPHRNGNIWASALWDVRTALGNHLTDLMVMKALVLCGKVGPEGISASAIEQQIGQKDEMRDGLAMLLKADEALNQAKNRAQILKILDKRGIDLTTPDKKFG